MVLVARVQPERHVGARADLEHDLPLGELGDQCGILDRPYAVRHPRDRQRQRGADRAGAVVLAGVDGAAEPGRRRGLIRAREQARGPRGLVADEVEADHVRMAVVGVAADDRLRRLDAEVAHGGDHDPALDPVRVARVVDPLGDAGVVLGVREADGGGVVGRRDQLDVDGALGRARAQVFEGDVAVILRGADDAGGEVVGAQEVQEVAPLELLVAPEHALEHGPAVAGGQPPDQRRRRRALEVYVQLGLRHRGVRRRDFELHPILPATTGRAAGGSSWTVTAARSASIASSAAVSLAAWTTASGRSAPTSAPVGAISVSPTAGSMTSSSWRRLPPRPVTTRPTARQSIAVTTPGRSGVAARTTGAA